MSDTPRLKLPLLVVGQAQKELRHNEALALLDCLVQATCQSGPINDPPNSVQVGQAFLCGPNPVGPWAGRPHAVALWTEGGWRFVTPFEGQKIVALPTGLEWQYLGGSWSRGVSHVEEIRVGGKRILGTRKAAISDVAGGGVIDVQARATVQAMLTVLREHGLIES